MMTAMSIGCLVFGPGAITVFALAAILQQHNPKAPQMLVRSTLANARTST
jgi:phosphatidylserine decarboxylase